MAIKSSDLDSELVETIARRVAELLAEAAEPEPQGGLVDAAAVARELRVERDWVYSHAHQLGAVRLGGPRGRLRFDMTLVKERLGGADPASWRPPRRAPRRAAARKKAPKPSRGELKFRPRNTKGAGRRGNATRPDTGR